ncbi:hypothetical protein T484DRAFT_1858370 [Baffinella frigidus]|nr:hypothetical protein T484DRAFT_1858370 [Cryptophyta sp. CCMP2293]
MPQDQQRHQQVVEDLVNDLLCNCSSFGSTTADPPRRRRRMRPTHPASPSGASYIPLGAPLVQGTSVPPSVSPLALPSPTTSPKYDSLCAHSRETSSWSTPTTSRSKYAVARSSVRDSRSPVARSSGRDSPLAHSAHRRHAHAECASRAHMHHAKADKLQNASRRSQTAGDLSQPARSACRLSVALERAPSPSRRNVASGLSKHLKATSHAIIATRPTRLTIADLGGGVSNDPLTMLQWEHQERVAATRRRQNGQEWLELEAGRDDADGVALEWAFHLPGSRQPASKPLVRSSTDALFASLFPLSGSKSLPLSLIARSRTHVFDPAIKAGG